MTFRGPHTVVNPAPLAGPATGLLEAATIIEPDDEHWLAGITFRPENAAPLRGVDPCALTAGPATPYTGKPPILSDGFILEQEDSCSAFGWREADYVGRARRGIGAKESQGLEAEFWTPTITPTNYGLADGIRQPTDVVLTNADPHLTSASSNWQAFMQGWTVVGANIPANTHVLSVEGPGALTMDKNATLGVPGGELVTFRDPNLSVLNGGTAVAPGLALAYLNEAIARSTLGLGWIHATAFLVERWFAARAVIGNQGPTARLFSVNGNTVIAGNGYSGAGPDGTGGPADGQGAAPVQWAFVTEPFQVYRTPEAMVYPGTLAEASQRELNLVTYRASRPYAHNWGRLLKAAIKVNVAASG